MDDGATRLDTATPLQEPGGRSARSILARLLGAFVAVGSLGTLWAASLPGSAFFVLLPLALLWLASAGIWIALVVQDVRRRRPGAVTVLVPLVVIATASLMLTDVPLQVRFDLSRGAMQHAVDTMPADADMVLEPGLIGTYVIRSMERVDGGVILAEAIGDSLINDAGFAYLPAGPTPELENGSFERPQWHDLGGGWWSWTASW